jgi:hypothetical protein
MSEIAKQKPKKKSILKILITIYLGIFIALVLAWGINLGWHVVNLYGLAKNIQEDPTQLQGETIVPLVKEAASDVEVIYKDLRPLFPIFNALQGIPWAGPYLGQVDPLLTYADGLAQAGKEIVMGLELLLENAQTGQTNNSLLESASQAMESGQVHFVNAAQALDQANQARSKIRPEILPDSVRLQFLKLDGNFDLLRAGIKALQSAPQLLGAGEAQNYLVLAQNRDELRATGGFISGIGLVSIQDGKIEQLILGDSFQIDDFSKGYPTPPDPLMRFMLADYWVTRDANWSPDFPTAAQEAQTLYTLSTGNQTQGVIAFNQLAVRRLLEVVGPVQVPGIDELITADNVEEYMRQAWAPTPEEGLSQEWWLHRKDFMQQLGNAILEKMLESSNQEQLLNLAKTIIDLLYQGQLLVYFNEPQAQAALGAGGWDGSVNPESGDYLYLVDSNVGFNKVDSLIQRSLTYQVDLSDLNHPTGKVTVNFQHTGNGDQACRQEISYGNGTYQDMQQRCYLDYWRVYVPGGSELLTSTAQSVPADELLSGVGWSGQVESIPGEAGTQVFAGLLMLPPSQTSQIDISYSLPRSVVQQSQMNLQEYNLKVQVQPGLAGLPYHFEVKLPDDTIPLSMDEGWVSLGSQTWSWQGILDKTIEIKLLFPVTQNSNPLP